MARLPYLSQEDLAEQDRDVLTRPGNLFRVLAHSPEAFRRFGALGGWIRSGSALDPRLRELAILQVGYLTRSQYEYAHHIEIGRRFGVSDDDIRAIAAESAGEPTALAALDRAVLQLTREMTADVQGSEDAFGIVREGLGPEQTIDLLMTIAYYNLVVRLLLTLEVELEDGYRPLLAEFPLPDA